MKASTKGLMALVDMDLIVYRVGAACDNRYYEYSGEKFESYKDLRMHLKRICDNDEEVDLKAKTAEKLKEPEEWDDVRDSIISFTEGLLEPYYEYKGFISGKGNFRYSQATILPYKGNRDSQTRPFWYDEIRQLLVDVYDAEQSFNMEADDCLGLNQNEGTIILTLDKDLDMIPGAHYNWDHDKAYFVDEVDAIRNFYCQMLTGDSTDNILGLHGVGQSSKLLKNIRLMEDEDQMKKYVTEQYEARFGSYAERFLIETSKLLWILRSDKRNPFTDEEYWNANWQREPRQDEA